MMEIIVIDGARVACVWVDELNRAEVREDCPDVLTIRSRDGEPVTSMEAERYSLSYRVLHDRLLARLTR